MHVHVNDLLQVTIVVAPRQLERLLDALAMLPHYINPELKHGEWATEVQFPAWRSWLDGLREMLAREGFDGSQLKSAPALDALREAVHEG